MEIMGHIKYLAGEIGPRATGSLREKRAADYVENFFNYLRISQVGRQSFRTLSSLYTPFKNIQAAVIISALIFPVHLPVSGYISALIVLFCLYLYLSILRFDLRALKMLFHFNRDCQNAYAVVPPLAEKKRTVVISAHLDSGHCSLLFHPRMVGSLRINSLSDFYGIGLIVALYVISLILANPLFYYLALVPLFFMLIGLVLMIWSDLFMPYSPGANDNASSVGVLLSLAEELSRQPLKNTEVYLAATGSEEVFLLGMEKFITEMKDALQNPYFIVLDDCGVGEPVYLKREGVLFPVLPQAEMLRFLPPGTATYSFDNGYTELSMIASHKLKGICLGAMPAGGRIIPRWHWTDDTVEKLDPAAPEKCRALARQVLERIDSDA
jgi:hypothetical protein